MNNKQSICNKVHMLWFSKTLLVSYDIPTTKPVQILFQISVGWYRDHVTREVAIYLDKHGAIQIFRNIYSGCKLSYTRLKQSALHLQ